MPKRAKWALLCLVLTVPTIALGGWFQDILGAGEVAKATADITQSTQDLIWKQAVLDAIVRNIRIVVLLSTMVSALFALIGAGYLARGFGDTCREAMRDDKVTAGEWVIIGLQAFVQLPVIASLGGYGIIMTWTLIFSR